MEQMALAKRTETLPVEPKRGRGRPRKESGQLNVALSQEQFDDIDAFRKTQERDIGRPEAVRRMLAMFCKEMQDRVSPRRGKLARKGKRA